MAGEHALMIWAVCAISGAAMVWRGSALGRLAVRGGSTAGDAIAARLYVLLGGAFLLFAPLVAKLVS